MPFHNPIWEVIEPHLVRTGLYKVPDPTYGRWLLPHHPPHLALVNDLTVSHNYRRVFLPPITYFKSPQEAWDTTQIIHAEDVKLVEDELASGVKRGGRWVAYSTWEMTSPPEGGWEGAGRGVGKDLVLVHVSKESRPNILLEYIGRAIVFFGGSLPLAKAVRGNVSSDPRVEEDFFSDPLCYHGMLRVGTGLACLEGMIELEKRAHEIDVPIRLVHGNKDRATSHIGTLKLFDRLPNDDKELEIYDGYEHVMLRLGLDEEDDKPRQRVLDDMRSWLLQRC
ncbi:hypothetical protein IAR50_001197 [Cryptococcus sp. DSM 104548]